MGALVWINDLSSFLQGKKWIYKEATTGVKEAFEKAVKTLAYGLEAVGFQAVDNCPFNTYPAWQEAGIFLCIFGSNEYLCLLCARLQAKGSPLQTSFNACKFEKAASTVFFSDNRVNDWLRLVVCPLNSSAVFTRPSCLVLGLKKSLHIS